MVLDWFFKDSSESHKKPTPEESRRLVAQFNEWSPRIPTIPEPISVITFDAAMKYFESDRPSNSHIKKCAIVRQNHREGQLLAQVFLDRSNQLVVGSDGTPYGRQLVARKFDQKLRDMFGENDLIIVEQKAQKPTLNEFDRSIFSLIHNWLSDIVRIPQVVPVMTYEAAIQYFVTNRPDDSRVKKGVILRQPHAQGQHLIQVFLDRENDLVLRPDGKPYGRQLVVRELDAELRDTFGNKDLIIVE